MPTPSHPDDCPRCSAVHARWYTGRERRVRMGRNRESAWERNRVSGNTVVRRHAGISPGLGRVYEAFNRVSGNPVVLVAPGQEGEWGHLPSWQMKLTASTEPGCYALELERAPSAERHLPELTLALYRLARALAQVDGRPEAREALLGGLATARRSRARWRGRGVQALVALAACLLAGVFQHAQRVRIIGGAQDVQVGDVGGVEPVAVGDVAALAAPVAVAPRQVTLSGLRLDLPVKPWPQQNLAPCEEGEYEIKLKDGSRSCWVGVKLSADTCKRRGYEHKGGCYWPSYPPPKVPQSERE